VATEAGDAYCQALSLNCAGLAAVEHGDPNEGLKLLQVGTVTARDVPPDRGAVVVGEGSRAALQACASADSATALGRLGYPGGDLDCPAAVLELDRGRLDPAESFAASSVRRWEGGAGSTTPSPPSSWPRFTCEPRGLALAQAGSGPKGSTGRRNTGVPRTGALCSQGVECS
jgi:hypothetical protein